MKNILSSTIILLSIVLNYNSCLLAQDLNNIPNAYATYIGGSSADRANAITLDKDGFLYISGFTTSLNFPVTPGAYCTIHNDETDNLDGYMAKIDLDANRIIWATYLGGSGTEYMGKMSFDEEGNIYVVGNTTSNDFPFTTGAYDTIYNYSGTQGHGDAYVAKLSSNGSSLLYSSFLGGNGREGMVDLATDDNQFAYTCISTSSSDYPRTPGCVDTIYEGPDYLGEIAVTKFNKKGDNLEYSFFLGGNKEEMGKLLIDSKGNLVIVGSTLSKNFPVTDDAMFKNLKNKDTTNFRPGGDLFISLIDSSGKDLIYSTFFGGSGGDWPTNIMLDKNDILYITGDTKSFDFPVTDDAYQKIKNDTSDAFLIKFNLNEKKLEYSTYIGGDKIDQGSDILLTKDGNIVLVGNTLSSDFPITDKAFDTTYNGCTNPNDNYEWGGDFFISVFDSALSNLLYSTYLGGTSDDYGPSATIDENSNLFIYGSTKSSDFPVTDNAIYNVYNGGHWRAGDGILIKLSLDDLMNYNPHVGVSIKKKDNALKLFPNPTQNILQIEYPGLQQKDVNYKIIDLTGKILQEEDLVGNTIEISKLYKGIYFLNLNIEGENLSQKIIIE